MRNAIKSILAAAVVGVGMSHGAQADTLLSLGGYNGPIYIQYSNFDVGRFYGGGVHTVDYNPGLSLATNANNGAAAVDALGPNPVIVGGTNAAEDTWGTVKVSGIWGGFDNTGPVLYNAATSSIQLTAIFWGGRDIQVVSNAASTQEDIWTDSIQMSFFASTVGNNADGIDFPVSGGNAANRTNPGGIPNFAGVTDGTLIWTLKGATGVSAFNPAAELHVQLDVTAVNSASGGVVGGGQMFLDLAPNAMGVGAQQSLLKADPTAPDVTVAFQDFVAPAGSNYSVRSSDPALAVAQAVPTPSALWGGALLMGVAGINAIRRRRNANA